MKTKTKVFSSYNGPQFKMPDLVKTQYDSYEWLWKDGIKELLKEISPIRDHMGDLYELHFVNCYLDKPKYTEEQARSKDQTYEAPLWAEVRLKFLQDGTSTTQEVYLGDFPVMTEQGTFIINGVERVIISQLIRSPGVYFGEKRQRGEKTFGAKIIPNRGSWLEFETTAQGLIGVKIDRKRRVPVTQLLRVFGMEGAEDMRKAVQDVDAGEVKYLEETLKRDSAKDTDEAYMEIYRALRPGDVASIENAKALIDPIFKDADRYDLHRVGRYKFNSRLGLTGGTGLLRQEDVVAVVREIMRLNNAPGAEEDDIDHLGHRRVRAVGELVQSRMRVGFARLRRVAQDRMSTMRRDELQPSKLINYKTLSSVVHSFFSTSQLSQFMDQTNPLAELEHKRRLSSVGPGGLTRERAGFEVRDVHTSYYGRICPIQTPEGANIGLVNSLASYAELNDLGFLITPYFKVEDGKVTDEVVWLDAFEELQHSIVQADVALDETMQIRDKEVNARVNGEAGMCKKNEVTLMDVSPTQMLSVATALIPFLEHDDANRALMGSNMQRQAVPPVRPQAPLVGTGMEERVVRDSQQAIFAREGGKVTAVDGEVVKVKTEHGTDEYPLVTFRRTNDSTCISQRPRVELGETVKKGDLLADGPATDEGRLALGQNLLVAFIPWQGANFEDAVIVSNRVAEADRFSSVHIETYVCPVRDTRLGPEMTTPDIPNVSEEKLRNLDEEGIIRIGAEVRDNDILVGKISPKGESELTPEERLLRAIFGEKARDIKDSSLTLPHGKQGRVIGVKIFSREKGDKLEPGIIKKIQVEVAQLRRIKAGDKMAGRHGNKGVISRIQPVEDMPFLEDGRPVDVILNPLGVISRMNLGQILETHLGFAAEQQGYKAIVPNFVGISEEDIARELRAAGLPENGKVALWNGMTGEKFAEPVTVGYIYMLKLHHLVEDKIHMRSTGPYSLITQQPLGGKAQLGGQRFGEMEVWALEGYGAAHILQEMLTIKSDDVLGRASAFEAIIRGQSIKKPTIPTSFNVLLSELKSLGMNITYGSEHES